MHSEKESIYLLVIIEEIVDLVKKTDRYRQISFPAIEAFLRRKHFSNDEELKETVLEWFQSQEDDFYTTGVSSLITKWNKCLNQKWGCVEK